MRACGRVMGLWMWCKSEVLKKDENAPCGAQIIISNGQQGSIYRQATVFLEISNVHKCVCLNEVFCQVPFDYGVLKFLLIHYVKTGHGHGKGHKYINYYTSMQIHRDIFHAHIEKKNKHPHIDPAKQLEWV